MFPQAGSTPDPSEHSGKHISFMIPYFSPWRDSPLSCGVSILSVFPKNLTFSKKSYIACKIFWNVRFLEILPPGFKGRGRPIGCGWVGSGIQFPSWLNPLFHDATDRRLEGTDFRKILHSSKNLTFLEKSYIWCKIFWELQSLEFGEIVENPSQKFW